MGYIRGVGYSEYNKNVYIYNIYMWQWDLKLLR